MTKPPPLPVPRHRAPPALLPGNLPGHLPGHLPDHLARPPARPPARSPATGCRRPAHAEAAADAVAGRCQHRLRAGRRRLEPVRPASAGRLGGAVLRGLGLRGRAGLRCPALACPWPAGAGARCAGTRCPGRDGARHAGQGSGRTPGPPRQRRRQTPGTRRPGHPLPRHPLPTHPPPGQPPGRRRRPRHDPGAELPARSACRAWVVCGWVLVDDAATPPEEPARATAGCGNGGRTCGAGHRRPTGGG